MDQREGEGVVAPIVFVLARNVGRGKVERDHLIELHRQRAVSGGVLVTVAVGVDAVDFCALIPSVSSCESESEARTRSVTKVPLRLP